MKGRGKAAEQRARENRNKRRAQLQPGSPDGSRDVAGHISEASVHNSDGGDDVGKGGGRQGGERDGEQVEEMAVHNDILQGTHPQRDAEDVPWKVQTESKGWHSVVSSSDREICMFVDRHTGRTVCMPSNMGCVTGRGLLGVFESQP
jgi:hypothetical protein